MSQFDYSRPAELYPSKRRSRYRGSPISYKRFDSAAEAIQYAVEVLHSDLLHGTYLEIEEERFEGGEILRLYENASYPLSRRARS